MFEEYENKKRRDVSRMRSILDYVIGVIIIGFGVVMFFRDKMNLAVNEQLRPPDMLDKVLGVICVVYGAWRIYRGYKKNYFR